MSQNPKSSPPRVASEPNIQVMAESVEKSNITCRYKRKHGETKEILMEEMKELFSNFTAKQDAKLQSLLDSINGIIKQNNEFRESFAMISEQYEQMKLKLEKVQEERKEELSYIQQLEEKIESLEKSKKSTSIEIRNIPAKKGETKVDLLQVVCAVGKGLNCQILNSEIRDIYRTNTKSSAVKPIIVDFVSVLQKDNLLSSYKNFNKVNKGNRLSTNHLGLQCPQIPIFIAENLTFKTKRLFYLAREFAKVNEFSFCWTAHGKIYLRKKEGMQSLHVKAESDLRTINCNQ